MTTNFGPFDLTEIAPVELDGWHSQSLRPAIGLGKRLPEIIGDVTTNSFYSHQVYQTRIELPIDNRTLLDNVE